MKKRTNLLALVLSITAITFTLLCCNSPVVENSYRTPAILTIYLAFVPSA